LQTQRFSVHGHGAEVLREKIAQLVLKAECRFGLAVLLRFFAAENCIDGGLEIRRAWRGRRTSLSVL
jgi:hypothetical protein